MEIGGFSQAYSGYPNFSQVADAKGREDRTKGPETEAETRPSQRDFDGNPYYDDPQHANGSLPILGYRRDGLLEMGVGSDAASGIAGLGESLSEYGERTKTPADSAQPEFGADTAAPEEDLKAFRDRDNEVRTHEMAHLSAAGGLARGGIQLSYQIGPDGKPYAVGGSVQIDTSEGASPEETLAKAAQIEAAATAPANPSPQDLKVAAQARRMAEEARQEIAERQRESVEQPIEGATPTTERGMGEMVSRIYGAAVYQDPTELAFKAVA